MATLLHKFRNVMPQLSGMSLAPGSQLTTLMRSWLLSFIGITVFVLLWQGAANNIDTSLGKFPGPQEVIEQSGNLYAEYQREQQNERDFYVRQEARNAERLASNPDADVSIRPYTGRPTFIDQIGTSLLTVAFGFAIAMAVAIPLGIFCGLSEAVYSAVNPVVQIFKPVSPLAWLPLVTMVVSALYVSESELFSKAFVTSAVTVALCCLWPTVINTTVGVASVDKDLINVSRVIRLPPLQHIRKIVLPSAIPMIFTGMRLSLATGWMVLIAAEMLAQSPGLGKFIWDEFQNGSSDSMGRIMVAVLVIGIIGFILDKLMLTIQRYVSWDKTSTLR
ncbi:ABC transporter permease [Pseudohongiella acticola]|uniref:ABC transporter permease n=1 Tax=Pseudohongiella acticola TaxID=1524254 RepID=UPI0014715EF4|nr:ABC transporter permease [Pseudohongiella acticola]